MGEGTLEQIIEEINGNIPLNLLEVKNAVKALQERGFIGMKHLKGKNVYFCII